MRVPKAQNCLYHILFVKDAYACASALGPRRQGTQGKRGSLRGRKPLSWLPVRVQGVVLSHLATDSSDEVELPQGHLAGD